MSTRRIVGLAPGLGNESFAKGWGALVPNTTGLGARAGSPTIDRGAKLPAPYNLSINAAARPIGAAADAGAYEFELVPQLAAPTNLRIVE